MPRFWLLSCCAATAFLALAITTWTWYAPKLQTQQAIENLQSTLEQEPADFDRDARAYRTLLETIGASAAQDALLRFAPATPRTHMINHESGFYLYDTQGPNGLGDCKNYFNGGCYHGFVERALEEQGLGAINSIIDTCRGERSLTQARECTHGAGHAILIAHGYEHLDHAVAYCRAAFGENTRAIEDCNDGVFMENNFGGFDVPPENRWFNPKDPLYPCTDPRIQRDDIAYRSCLFLQTQATLQSSKYPELQGSLPSAVSFCTQLPGTTETNYCFLGLARQIQAKHIDDIQAIKDDCETFPSTRIAVCMRDAAASAYAFGATQAAFSLCRDSTLTENCFEQIFERIHTTGGRTWEGKLRACAMLPEAYRHPCTQYMEARL